MCNGYGRQLPWQTAINASSSFHARELEFIRQSQVRVSPVDLAIVYSGLLTLRLTLRVGEYL